jgi:hypothetical protein
MAMVVPPGEIDLKGLDTPPVERTEKVTSFDRLPAHFDGTLVLSAP